MCCLCVLFLSGMTLNGWSRHSNKKNAKIYDIYPNNTY